jgi:hypothetical protein
MLDIVGGAFLAVIGARWFVREAIGVWFDVLALWDDAKAARERRKS